MRKRVFLYDYFDNLEKLDEIVLPEQKYLFNKLNHSDISDDEKEHVKLDDN